MTAEPVDQHDKTRVLRWGRQVDVRVVRPGARTEDPAGPLTGEQVAGYLAKYATKDATSIAGNHQGRAHLRVMRAVCAELAARAACAHEPEHDYRRMGKWVHCLGFRGHFSTKSRRYSITLGALRRARTRWQQLAAASRRTGEPLDTADLERRLLDEDEDDTTLVVGSWTYAGTGWGDATQEALALAAANRAREYDQWRAEQRGQKRGAGPIERVSRA